MNFNNKQFLSEEVEFKIVNLQNILLEKRKQNLSKEEIIEFLRSAMNYSKFQIWLITNQINGVELSLDDKLKKFLAETTDEEILVLYDIEQNYDTKVNITEKFERQLKR